MGKVLDPVSTAADSLSTEPPPDPAGGVERLFREHNRALVSFLAARLGSEQEARELAQEAYVRLLRLDHPSASSFLRAHLFHIAANLAIDRLRQRAFHARTPLNDLFQDLLFTPTPTPEHQAFAHAVIPAGVTAAAARCFTNSQTAGSRFSCVCAGWPEARAAFD